MNYVNVFMSRDAFRGREKSLIETQEFKNTGILHLNW